MSARKPTPGPGVPVWAWMGMLLIGLAVLAGGLWLLNNSTSNGVVSSQIDFSSTNPDFVTNASIPTLSGASATASPRRAGTAQSFNIPPTVSTTIAAQECLAAPSANATEVQSCVSNAAPDKNSIVTVYGRLVAGGQPVTGLTMETSWDHKFLNGTCSATTDGRGVARCSRNISNATRGYAVIITVKFKHDGKTYTGETSFTPR